MAKKFKISFRGETYLFEKYEAKVLFYWCMQLEGQSTRNNQWKKQYYKEQVDKFVNNGIANGKIVKISPDEYPEKHLYRYEKSLSQMRFLILHPHNLVNQVIWGIIFGGFIGLLITGLLWSLLLCAFGVVSLLVEGIILGRDLEKSYSYD